MMRNCLAKTIRGRWFKFFCLAGPVCAAMAAGPAAPGKHAAARDLAALTSAFRQSPTPANRQALASFAATQATSRNGLLARLAWGVAAYEQKDYPTAIAQLRTVHGKLPALADYAAYYLGAALLETKQPEAIAKLEAVHSAELRSPLAGRAWILEARALAERPSEAVRLLSSHYAELPQPEGDLALADSYQAAQEPGRAAEYYQRIYYRYLKGAAADRAATALAGLKDRMGAAYPSPPPEQQLAHAALLLEAGEYRRARAEYVMLSGQLASPARDEARVRIGAADLLGGKPERAEEYLRSLEVANPESDAERLYYLVECARRAENDPAMSAALEQLAKQHPHSPWRLKALASAAARFLVINRPAAYLPLYQTAYQSFPEAPAAGLYHWKVTFRAYLEDDPQAETLLREHLLQYPEHPTAAAALYFLGRQAERRLQFSTAHALYRRLTDAFPNTYYGLLARTRLQQKKVSETAPSAAAERFAASLRFPPVSIPDGFVPETALRIERARLLRIAGLDDLADGELRFGVRNGGQAFFLGLEMATHSRNPAQAIRVLKATAPDYLRFPLDRAPRTLWTLLFPLPYRTELERSARQWRIDPFLLAGLIRQESEFDPKAVSRANAYGLTQVRPSTARQVARRVGIRHFASSSLFQPAINLNFGAFILRSMLDQCGENFERTLAAYNAGASRVADWAAWSAYREPAEFVESIPFSETREYVQAVLRNADLYRRLYGRR
jgi:soluble lytic murein transglycosylase